MTSQASSSGDRIVSGLGVARIVAGTTIFAAPSLIGQVFTGTPSKSPSARLFARAMGIREIALGIGIVTAGPHPRPWLLAAVAADLGDAVASLLMQPVDQNRRRWSFAASVVPALFECGLIGASLRRTRRP